MMVKNERESNISELDEELLLEIFSRLGLPKYASRCKSVCKRWCSLINTNSSSDSYFLRRWHQIYSELPVLLLTEERWYPRLVLDHTSSHDLNTIQLPTLDLNFLPCRSYFGERDCFILSACKDLLLCCSHRHDHSCYYLCNPFTKQWTALPGPPPLPEEDLHYQIGIALSVYDEDHSRGSSFTVVRVVPYHTSWGQEEEDVHILVFSPGGSHDGWRKIDCGYVQNGWGNFCHNVVSYSGDFVWITIPYNSSEPIRFKLNPYHAHTSFYQSGLLVESFSSTPDFETDGLSIIVGVSQGHLRLAQLVNDGQKMSVWQFNHGPKQVLEKIQELDFSELEDSEDLSIARACYQHEYGRVRTSILAFHPHDGDILYLSFSLPVCESIITHSSYTFSCNLTKKRLELIRKVPAYVRDDIFPLVLPCWPTSVPQLY